MKKIVTHINPDLDAVASVWLLKRFLPGWKEAEVGFVAAGSIKDVDSDSSVLYVDVGNGKLDHHQTSERLSASHLCWQYIQKKRQGQKLSPLETKALGQLVEVATSVDNADDLSWQEVVKPRYYFYLHTVIDGLRGLGKTDQEVIDFGMQALDTVLWNLKNKIQAKTELAKGKIFQSPWGKAIAVETGSKHVLWVGEIQGFILVIKKDPETGAVRMYARPDSEVDLTKAYNRFEEMDPESDWFLHATKRLLLNDSGVNPDMRATKLSLEEIIEVLKA